jgi:hypothetical protein
MRLESDLPCFEKFDLKLFRDRFLETASDNDVLKPNLFFS